jgi:cysteine desulfurase family protein
MIYFDNAATTLKKPQSVIDAVTFALTSYGNSGRGAYKSALDSGRMIYETRVKLAKFFGSNDPSKVIFTYNATESLNTVLFGLLHSGDHVISTVTEHNSVLRPLYKLSNEREVSYDFVGINDRGVLKYEEFKRYIKENTKAIVVNHVSNVTGEVANLHYISKVAKENNIYLIVDASQSAGNIKIDMEETGIDILCFTGHKSLFGPGGTGGIVINEDIDLDTFKVGGSGIQSFNKEQPKEYPTRLEAGTLNIHGIAGLSAGIDFINESGIENIHEKEMQLLKQFYMGIKDIENIRIYLNSEAVADNDFFHGGILSLNMGKLSSGEISDILATEYNIATRPGAHCAPLMHNALGTADTGVVRFSFSYFNTPQEIETAIFALKELAKNL